MELDLGCSCDSPKGITSSPESNSPKKSYPSFSIRDEAYDAFKKQYGPCEVGDEYTAEFKVKVSGVRQDEYGRSIEFQVISVMGDSIEEDESEEEDEAPKKGAKPPAKALAESEGKTKRMM